VEPGRWERCEGMRVEPGRWERCDGCRRSLAWYRKMRAVRSAFNEVSFVVCLVVMAVIVMPSQLPQRHGPHLKPFAV
jgi:hypothetical protein